MKSLVLCISGSGGGNGGPSSIYHKLSIPSFEIVSLDTFAKNITMNFANLVNIIDTNKDRYKDVFLIGWSMGGPAVLQTAYFVNKYIKKDFVKAVILLAAQNKEAEILSQLDIPVYFIHGGSDTVIPPSISELEYSKYNGPKKFNIIDNDTHNFNINPQKLHDLIVNYLTSF